MSDPWLTKDGKLHPAAEWGGMPEWVGCESEDEGALYRLARESGMWRVRWDSPASGWADDHYITSHEAAALLEKAAQGWLVAKYAVDGGTLNIDCEGVDGYCYITVQTRDGMIRTLGEGDTYTTALQAACMAAKGESDDATTDE